MNKPNENIRIEDLLGKPSCTPKRGMDFYRCMHDAPCDYQVLNRNYEKCCAIVIHYDYLDRMAKLYAHRKESL